MFLGMFVFISVYVSVIIWISVSESSANETSANNGKFNKLAQQFKGISLLYNN